MSAPAVITRRPLKRIRVAARAPRFALYATLGVLSLAGLRAALAPAASKPATVSPTARADLAAEQFATQFARAYLTYRAANPDVHQSALAGYINASVGTDAGFTPSASQHANQSVLWASPLQDQQALAGGRLVTVIAQVSTQPDPVYLTVDVVRLSDGSLALGGYPSFVGPPQANTSYTPPARQDVTDPQLKAVAQRVATNYLAGNSQNLAADVTPGTRITLPTQTFNVTQVQSVQSTGPGGVLITVVAQDSQGANYTLSYELGVTLRERWYATSIEVFPNQS